MCFHPFCGFFGPSFWTLYFLSMVIRSRTVTFMSLWLLQVSPLGLNCIVRGDIFLPPVCGLETHLSKTPLLGSPPFRSETDGTVRLSSRQMRLLSPGASFHLLLVFLGTLSLRVAPSFRKTSPVYTTRPKRSPPFPPGLIHNSSESSFH